MKMVIGVVFFQIFVIKINFIPLYIYINIYKYYINYLKSKEKKKKIKNKKIKKI